jgi:DNA-binding CsgD family transcriptional regulator
MPRHRFSVPPTIRPALGEALARLSPDERLLTVHLLEGLTNREIARILGWSAGQVQYRTEVIFDKFGVTTRLKFMASFIPLANTEPVGGVPSAPPPRLPEESTPRGVESSLVSSPRAAPLLPHANIDA